MLCNAFSSPLAIVPRTVGVRLSFVNRTFVCMALCVGACGHNMCATCVWGPLPHMCLSVYCTMWSCRMYVRVHFSISPSSSLYHLCPRYIPVCLSISVLLQVDIDFSSTGRGWIDWRSSPTLIVFMLCRESKPLVLIQRERGWEKALNSLRRKLMCFFSV